MLKILTIINRLTKRRADFNPKYWGVLLPNFFPKKKRQYLKKALPQLKRETYVYGQMIANNNEKINWRFKHWKPPNLRILPIFSPKGTPQYLRQSCPLRALKSVKWRAFFLVSPVITLLSLASRCKKFCFNLLLCAATFCNFHLGSTVNFMLIFGTGNAVATMIS